MLLPTHRSALEWEHLHAKLIEAQAAGVVRPLLLHGLHADAPEGAEDDAMAVTAGDGEAFAAQELACEELGAVMLALLPGIDANDSGKTTATIALYLSVLSNCVAFTGRDYPAKDGEAVLELGFYAEEFVLGFLGRLFGLMQDVDVSDSTADGTSQTHGYELLSPPRSSARCLLSCTLGILAPHMFTTA